MSQSEGQLRSSAVAGRRSGHALRDMLSLGLGLDVLDGDVVNGELEVVDGAHDGGVEAVGEHLGGERIWGLDDKDAADTVEGQGVGVPRQHQARVPLPRRRQVVAKSSQGVPT